MKAKLSRENALLASPLVLFLLALLGFPTLLSLVYGFSETTFETLAHPRFSGLQNFRDVLARSHLLAGGVVLAALRADHGAPAMRRSGWRLPSISRPWSGGMAGRSPS